MKTLLLMRHAKSSWKDSELADIERPLNKRGRRDVPLMAEVLADHELVPERILCSTALRARQTAEGLSEVIQPLGQIEYIDKLYMAEADEYLSELQKMPEDLERVMIIGHNPGLETLLQILSGQIESLPTAVIAYLVLPIRSWAELSSDTEGELIEIWRPKDVREELEEEKEKEEEEEKEKVKEKGKEKEKEKDKEKDKEKGKDKEKPKAKPKEKPKKKDK